MAGMAVIALVAPTMAAAPAGDRGPVRAAPRADNRAGPLTWASITVTLSATGGDLTVSVTHPAE